MWNLRVKHKNFSLDFFRVLKKLQHTLALFTVEFFLLVLKLVHTTQRSLGLSELSLLRVRLNLEFWLHRTGKENLRKLIANQAYKIKTA